MLIFIEKKIFPQNQGFCFLPLTSKKLKFSFVRFDSSELTYLLAIPFAYEASPNNKVYYGKDWEADEYSINGKIGNTLITCDTIGYQNFHTWRIIPMVHFAEPRGFYMFDYDSQEFANMAYSSKTPIVTRGETTAVEASDPELVSNNHYEIKNGQYFNVHKTFHKPLAYEVHWSYTHILRIKIRRLPKYGDFEPIYHFITDTAFQLQINWEGKLRIYGDENNWFSIEGPELQVSSSFSYLLMTWSKGNWQGSTNSSPSEYQCGVMIRIDSGEPHGGHMRCKSQMLKKANFFEKIFIFINF